MLDALSEHALRVDADAPASELEYGWSGGRHILDANFSFENNVFGDALHFALRIDQNRVPSELKKAYQLMEEDAAAASNPSGFISKNQKREAREITRRKVEDDLRSGKFRSSKLLPILWDLPTQTLYCNATGKSLEIVCEIFQRTFNLELEALGAGSLASRILERGHRRDYEDFRPTRFVHGPEGDSQQPEYPWVLKGATPKDFLGNEFLLWLWHEAEVGDGSVDDAAILIDRSLDLDCAYGQSGKDSLRGVSPTRMPEARDAIRSGKLPRKAGFVLDAAGTQFSFNFNAETLQLGSTKLPEVEADTPRVLFEERIGLLRDLSKSIDGLYEAFLKLRASSKWESRTADLRRWILASDKPLALARNPRDKDWADESDDPDRAARVMAAPAQDE